MLMFFSALTESLIIAHIGRIWCSMRSSWENKCSVPFSQFSYATARSGRFWPLSIHKRNGPEIFLNYLNLRTIQNSVDILPPSRTWKTYNTSSLTLLLAKSNSVFHVKFQIILFCVYYEMECDFDEKLSVNLEIATFCDYFRVWITWGNVKKFHVG